MPNQQVQTTNTPAPTPSTQLPTATQSPSTVITNPAVSTAQVAIPNTATVGQNMAQNQQNPIQPNATPAVINNQPNGKITEKVAPLLLIYAIAVNAYAEAFSDTVKNILSSPDGNGLFIVDGADEKLNVSSTEIRTELQTKNAIAGNVDTLVSSMEATGVSPAEIEQDIKILGLDEIE